jgi:serine/threonine protein kinase
LNGPMEFLTIPGFEFIEKIGQGGMAVVWKARQISLDRIVAIKFLQPQLVCDANEVDRLLTEARSAAKLKHVGIVQVYDANLSDGVPYVIMEYIAGYNVGDWVRRKGRLDECDALLVAECVATALNHAWTAAGIIHCDIKPDNVMVDRDGTIKVADLGLARSIGSRSGRASSEEVMGTPSYISPEQSQGGQALDCRTDIYSLGTMLYHLVTGRRLFDQYPDLEAMDRQITDQEPDPMDLNPSMSQGLAWLIEKMLAKDRENRQPDWTAVLKDIASVQAGRLPISPTLKAGQVSTIKRSARRHVPVRRPSRFSQPAAIGNSVGALSPEASSSGVGKILFYLILALAGAGLTVWGWRATHAPAHPVPVRPPVMIATSPPSPAVSSPTAPAVHEEKSKDMYDYVREYAIANPTDYGEIIEKYRKVSAQTKGTRYAMMAEEAMRNTRTEWRKKIDAALIPLREETERLCREGHWSEAADEWEGYSGVWAQETAVERQTQAREWRARAETIASDRKVRQVEEDRRFDRWIMDLAGGVVTGAPGLAVSNAFGNLDQWSVRRNELMEIQSALTAALNSDAMIMESYRPQIGQTITVTRGKGDKITFELQRVDPKALYGEQSFANGARIGLSIPGGDILLAEKFQRLGTEESSDVCLAKGLLVCDAGQFGRAAELFSKVKAPLGPALVKVAGGVEARRMDELAAGAAVRLLKQLGINVAGLDESTGATIRNLDELRWQDGVRQLAKYQEMYGNSTVGRKFFALWEVARQARSAPPLATPPADDPPQAEPAPVAGAPVDWERVQRSLLDRNPGLRPESIQMESDDHNRPIRLAIRSSEIQDAGSLENCDSIQELTLSPADDNDAWYRDKIAGLCSLVPLRKMPLRKLNVAYTLIDDLKPLANSRLVVLNLRKTGVSDLGPLLNCPIEEILLSGTEVKSLAALRTKNLRRLEINGLKINDLSPITGKQLKILDAAQTGIRDLNPLRGMPLVRLNLEEISAFDFSVLKTLTQLEDLNLAGTQFKDLSLFRQVPLRSLRIARTKINDLTPLKDLSLKALDIAETPVRDLEPLRLLPLERLVLSGSKVSSLVPLQKMKLRHLELARTSVRSLDPLLGQPLDYLDLSQTDISDLSVLKKMPLKRLFFNPKSVRDYDFLKRHPTLEEIWVDGEVPQSLNHTLDTIPYLRNVNNEKWRN